ALEREYAHLKEKLAEAKTMLVAETKIKESLEDMLARLTEAKEQLSQREAALSVELREALANQEEQQSKAKQAVDELQATLTEQESERGRAEDLHLKVKESYQEQERERQRADQLVEELTKTKALNQEE